MKKFILLFGMAALLAGCQGKGRQPADQAVGQEEMSVLVPNCEVNLSVEGMTCTGCENTIQEGISSLPGVAEVTASFETGIAHVRFDSTLTSIEAMKEAIEKKGYKYNGLALD